MFMFNKRDAENERNNFFRNFRNFVNFRYKIELDLVYILSEFPSFSFKFIC